MSRVITIMGIGQIICEQNDYIREIQATGTLRNIQMVSRALGVIISKQLLGPNVLEGMKVTPTL